MTKGERRDPRAERLERLAKEEPPSAAATSDRPRRDPHNLRQRMRLQEGRIDAHDSTGGLAGPAPQSSSSGFPKMRRIAQPSCLILAVPDLENGCVGAIDRDLMGGARILADAQGGAVVVLAIDAAPEVDFGTAGADRVISIRIGNYAPDACAAAVLAVMNELGPKHVLFCDTPAGGGDIGRRVAALQHERPATAIRELSPTQVIRYGGGNRVDLTGDPSRILLLLPHSTEPLTQDRHEALPIEPPVFDQSTRFHDWGLIPIDPDDIPLPEALLVCSAGNGVTDWAAFHAVAAALGASPAGSRVVCDARSLSRDRQVGASGTSVEARCYFAFGISGAPQHLQGITRCENVIAINTDPHAPMMRRADLAIVADAQAVMPALARLLKASRDGHSGHDA
jgi:electron transfer flavoprotein alpha subunit